jgi:hypothetical protein
MKGLWLRLWGIQRCQEIQGNFEASYIPSSDAKRLFLFAEIRGILLFAPVRLYNIDYH